VNDKVWSPQQEAVFEEFRTGRGHLVVRARAGTGKTTTVVHGVGLAPEKKVLMCAFNKAIAEELTRRITKVGVEAKTLHSVGFAFVRRQWGPTCRPDADRGFQLAQKVTGGPGVAPRPMVKLVAALAAKAKGCCPLAPTQGQLLDLMVRFDLEPDLEWEEEGWTPARVAQLAAKAMDAAAVPNTDMAGRPLPSTVDFDDMLFVAVRQRLLRPWYDLVVVDEAQDMNATQILIAQGVCRKGGRIIVVGDDRQAIYGFRGADSRSIDRLKAELSAKELPLTVTYRCPKDVVALAQALVPDFHAAPEAPRGKVRNFGLELLHAGKDVLPGDFVLSRTNAPLVTACLRLLRAGVRARIAGREIGKGILALIDRLHARDLPDLSRALVEWKRKEVLRVAGLCGDNEDLLEAKVQELEDTVETLAALTEGLSSIPELKARVESLFADDGRPSVVCSTVHKAKGLEAERVFVLADTIKAWTGTDEEANIAYVAITRAKAELVLVYKTPPATVAVKPGDAPAAATTAVQS
jgi:superfamily I DNA/RNA helicase